MKRLLPVLALAFLSVVLTGSLLAQNPVATPPAFTPHWSFNGQLFADYYYMMSADTASGKGYNGPLGSGYYEPKSNGDNNRYYQAFDMRRVQFGANYYFTKDITAKVLMEHESAYPGGDILADGKSGFYAKEASLTFSNWIPMANVILGQQAMNLFSVDEGLWGYRGVEKSILDFRGATETGSNDLGVQVQGNFVKSGAFSYSVALANFNNSSKVETLKDKVIAGQLTVRLLHKHLVLDLTGDYAGMPNATVLGADSTSMSVVQSRSLWKFAAAYSSKPITVGVVYAQHTLAGQSLAVAGQDLVQTALSIFAHGQIIPKTLDAFARYDLFDPDKNANSNVSGRKENFIVAGLDWLPDGRNAPNVHIDPNIEFDSFTDKGSQGLNYRPITVLRLTFFDKF